MTYAEKLKNPLWQKKRLKILERDEWKCTICGNTEKTLHVHHLKYTGNPWETSDSYLRTLCADCHKLQSDVNIPCAIEALTISGMCDSEIMDVLDRVFWRINRGDTIPEIIDSLYPDFDKHWINNM